MSKNDIHWGKLFQNREILAEIERIGYHIIRSEDINTERESRLMAKIDHSFQLPRVFFENGLSILPTSRGSYIISQIETFCLLPEVEGVIKDVLLPDFIESLNCDNFSSEAMALNGAFASGIFHEFSGEESLIPTVNGRMGSGNFDFNINCIRDQQKGLLQIDVVGSQIEIDAGYEGNNSLILVEAKNSTYKDFIIRQLYYPYRSWFNRINKPIRTVYLSYTNGIYTLREYAFDDVNYYNSIRLVNQGRYRITQRGAIVINTEVIERILNTVTIKNEPNGLPFPQADSFERVINLCEILRSKGAQTKEELVSEYDFRQRDNLDMRQVDYYTNAARYLGFVSKERVEGGASIFVLTALGDSLFEYSIQERQLEFAKSILSSGVFNYVLRLYFQDGLMPSRDVIVERMKCSNLYKVESNETFYRRSSTVVSWVDWIVGLIEE